MALVRWDPFTLLARLDDEFDDVVRRTFGSASFQFVPPVEMATEGSDVVLTLDGQLQQLADGLNLGTQGNTPWSRESLHGR